MINTKVVLTTLLLVVLAFVNISIGDVEPDKYQFSPEVLVSIETPEVEGYVKEDDGWGSVNCGVPDSPDYCLDDGNYDCCK